jgi:glucokinase
MEAKHSQSLETRCLAADIGGTHTRCTLIAGGRLGRVEVLKNEAYPDIGAVLRAGLERLEPSAPVTMGALAVAAPLRGDSVHMPNRGWTFSIEALRRELDFDRLELVNDFTAIALALPVLREGDWVAIGGGTAVARKAIAVLGPGTGLGVSALVPHVRGEGWAPVSGEGGHVTLAATNDLEARLLERGRVRFGHVSAERIVSGPGMLALYELLAEERGVTPVARRPEDVSARAAAGDPLARAAADLFFGFLGTVASDVALTFGALGGVYLAGGILPSQVATLAASPFRARFESKGRYGDYLRAIPTRVITAEQPALLGLQALVESTTPRG